MRSSVITCRTQQSHIVFASQVVHHVIQVIEAAQGRHNPSLAHHPGQRPCNAAGTHVWECLRNLIVCEGVIASKRLIIYPACYARHYLNILFAKMDIFCLTTQIYNKKTQPRKELCPEWSIPESNRLPRHCQCRALAK